MGDAIGVLMSVILVMIVSGSLGYKIARDHGYNPLLGLALGAGLPLVGIGLMLMLCPKTRR